MTLQHGGGGISPSRPRFSPARPPKQPQPAQSMVSAAISVAAASGTTTVPWEQERQSLLQEIESLRAELKHQRDTAIQKMHDADVELSRQSCLLAELHRRLLEKERNQPPELSTRERDQSCGERHATIYSRRPPRPAVTVATHDGEPVADAGSIPSPSCYSTSPHPDSDLKAHHHSPGGSALHSPTARHLDQSLVQVASPDHSAPSQLNCSTFLPAHPDQSYLITSSHPASLFHTPDQSLGMFGLLPKHDPTGLVSTPNQSGVLPSSPLVRRSPSIRSGRSATALHPSSPPQSRFDSQPPHQYTNHNTSSLPRPESPASVHFETAPNPYQPPQQQFPHHPHHQQQYPHHRQQQEHPHRQQQEHPHRQQEDDPGKVQSEALVALQAQVANMAEEISSLRCELQANRDEKEHLQHELHTYKERQLKAKKAAAAAAQSMTTLFREEGRSGPAQPQEELCSDCG